MATFDEVEKFFEWMKTLTLPGAPRFDSEETRQKSIREWHLALKNVPVAHLRALTGTLRDTLKRWPTISDIKGEITMFLNRNPLSAFNDLTPTHHTHFNGKNIPGGFAILSKEQAELIEAKNPGFTKNILRLNMSTGEITDPLSKRTEGNILQWPPIKEKR